MHTHGIRATRLTIAGLPLASRLHPSTPDALLGHLRWCLATPYAEAWGLFRNDELLALATLVHFGNSARVGCFHASHPLCDVAQQQLLVNELLRSVEARGCATLTVQVPPKDMDFWKGCGFTEIGAFITYANGNFLEATRDEVALMQPAHTLALLHLDQHATGEDRRTLLLEHHFAAHAYVVDGRVRGALLPLLGNGSIVADDPAVGLELQRWLLPTQHRITVPETNSAACEHLLDRDYDAMGTSVRMVWGSAPAFNADMVFAWPWGTP
ncbi:MAG: hypothetical protein JNL43_10895 [Flavobacteriales bacterium]|nr:hypothetical protein [Flavobacteriales bacterium]